MLKYDIYNRIIITSYTMLAGLTEIFLSEVEGLPERGE